MIPVIAAAAVVSGLPDIDHLNEVRRAPSITYLDRSGTLIGTRGGSYATPVDIDRLPAYVPAAFVAIEDRRFYEHPGFDPLGMARALAADVAKGRIAQGASTITQQLARNLFLTPDQTLERKAQEVILAVQLEQRYSKKQILGMYLSRIYFGGGAYGLEAASRRYFNKPAERLTLAEAAILAGIPKSPTHYNPADNYDASIERSHLVLDAMVDTGAISSAKRGQAVDHPPHAYVQPPTEAAQYFVDWVDGQTRQMMGREPTEDLVVQTTLDLPLELKAAVAAKAVMERHERQGVEQVAAVTLDGDGRVREMVGGVDYGASTYNRAILARRQPGSSWKPFVYLTAMEQGRTPDTPVVDEPVTINGWSPHNFEPDYLGPITLQVALTQSINTVAAELADQVGRDNVAATARRLGVAGPINTDPAMALGTTQVTPIEMSAAYDAFANGGYKVSAYGIETIRTARGRLLFQHRADAPASVIANPPLDEMQQMMRTVISDPKGTGAHATIAGYDLAGKTGTTSDFKDAWFDGYSGGVTTVVWLGRDDDTPMVRVTGGSAPVELWRSIMLSALPRLRATAIPPGPPPPAPLVPVAAPGAVPAAPVPGAEPAAPVAPPTDASPPGAQPMPPL